MTLPRPKSWESGPVPGPDSLGDLAPHVPTQPPRLPGIWRWRAGTDADADWSGGRGHRRSPAGAGTGPTPRPLLAKGVEVRIWTTSGDHLLADADKRTPRPMSDSIVASGGLTRDIAKIGFDPNKHSAIADLPTVSPAASALASQRSQFYSAIRGSRAKSVIMKLLPV